MTVRKLYAALALLGLLALAGCSGNAPSQTSTPTPPGGPTPSSRLELTFIGSDGNVWEMAWPTGTPKQLTTDAQANQVRYSGLAWAPDGSRLAVLRETGPLGQPTGDRLLLLSPTGQTHKTFSLIAQPYNTPFAWSPDGSMIAYRTTTERFDPATGDFLGRLTILDAQSGATKQTLLYDDGSGGCGGAFPPLTAAVMQAHQAYQGVDAFAWSPDQKSLLLSRGCGNNAASLVDLGTGKTTAGYPAGASYQPGSKSVMLGQWDANNTITLGLANASGARQQTLVSETLKGGGSGYETSIGVAVWSPDGQTIYFERDNGIWSVGANGSNAHQVVAGAATNGQGQATVKMLPGLSPDGALLLYLQLQGADTQVGSGSVTSQCYVARLDGSRATALPQGASSAVWRPVK